MKSNTMSRPPRLTLALFLFLLAIYLLTYTPRINSSDGLAMFATAENIVRRGALDIEQIRWSGLQQGTFGLDGLLYSRKGIGVPIGLLPLTGLGLMIPWFGPVSVSLLFNAIITALTAVVLLIYIEALSFHWRTGLLAALIFGLSTLAWPYAKSLFSDPFSGFLLLIAALMLFRVRQRLLAPSAKSPLGYAFLAGLFLGWNIATRFAEAVFIPFYGLLLLTYLYQATPESSTNSQDSKSRFTYHSSLITHHSSLIIAFCLPILLSVLLLLTFNFTRYGDILNTGYLPNETFSGILWQGIIGQLVSPGRGLLLYCPIFILSFWGIRSALRHFRAEAILVLVIIVVHLLLYGKWFMWHGGYAWGPRFMIPTLPFWTILLAPVTQKRFKNSQFTIHNLQFTIYLGLALLGLIPQLLSVAIHFAPFQDSLLANGRPLFDPETFFNPRFSPFLQAWAFIHPDTLDVAWAWEGKFNGWLLCTLLANIVISGFYLYRRAKNKRPQSERYLTILTSLFTLAILVFLLTYTHTLSDQSLRQATVALNQSVHPADVILTNDPNIAAPFAEQYKGRAIVLGLNNGDFPLPEDVKNRLREVIMATENVWWLPSWHPPQESGIEQTLLTNGYLSRQEQFAEQRLLLFSYPKSLPPPVGLNAAVFDSALVLDGTAYPATVQPRSALPIQLQWRALQPVAEDYQVFIHLLNIEGQVIAQTDGQPVNWTRPTSSWAVNEVIVDRHGLWISEGAMPGVYLLKVGLYRPSDGQRLQLPDGSDGVSFTVVVEEQPKDLF